MSDDRGTALARVESSADADLAALPQLMQLAKTLLTARGLIPEALKTEGQVLAVILAGRELGVPPMAALRGINVVRGKVGFDYSLAIGLLEKHGYNPEWLTSATDATRQVLRLKRPGAATPHEQEFTRAMAEQAQLWNSSEPWKKHPTVMLRARCVGQAMRSYAGGIFAGAYVGDEIEEVRGRVVESVADVVALPDRSELTATAVARLPEVSALAEEQAKRRLEDSKLVDAWIAEDLPRCDTHERLMRFVHRHWGQVRHMDKNAAGNAWRAILRCGRAMEPPVAESMMREWCKEAPDHDPESDDGPADAELVEDEAPLAEPPDDVPLLADIETAPPEAFTTVMESLAKCTHLSHWRNHLKKHRPAIDKLPARWREQALVDERAVAMQLGAKPEEMP